MKIQLEDEYGNDHFVVPKGRPPIPYYTPLIPGPHYEDHFVHTSALVELLADDVLFCNSFPFLYHGNATPQSETLVLFVNCSDLFAWGCADAESVTYDELETLYAWWRKSPIGSQIWCCLKRKMRPQPPVERDWKEKGLWVVELDMLPERTV
jgi:hypothetical protein